MTWQPLLFSDEDVMLIHHGLREREASFAAAAAAGRGVESTVRAVFDLGDCVIARFSTPPSMTFQAPPTRELFSLI